MSDEDGWVRPTRTEVVARDGMVVAKHRLAAAAGVEMLRRGGNAADAAVAAALAAGVVLPLSTGIGGGGYLLYHAAATGTTHALDFAMQAPAAAHERLFELDPAGSPATAYGWQRVKDDANWHGWRSIAIPGAVAGLDLALRRFGTQSFATVAAPAIALADDGFVIGPELALRLVDQWPVIMTYPSSAAVLTNGGAPLAAGQTLRQPALARTLRRLADAGAADFYEGQVARDVVADLQAGGGLLTVNDLAGYQPRVTDRPLTLTYRGATICGAPGATGAITALQMLNLLSGFDLAAVRALHGQAALLHLWIEVSRLALADRFQYVADPSFVDAPWRGLLSPAYAAERRQLIDPGAGGAGGRAADYTAGDPWLHEGRARPPIMLPRSRPWEPGGTTHITVVDRWRNVASLTQTTVSWSGIALPRTGIVMNNAMSWFDPEPGHPNSVAPGKRGLNNMTPVIVLAGGKPWAAAGARGGTRVIGTVAQVISNLLDHGMGIQHAVAAPKLDASVGYRRVTLDDRIPEPVRAALAARGHDVSRVPGQQATAGANGILIDPDTGLVHGSEDPFSEGIALGVDG